MADQHILEVNYFREGNRGQARRSERIFLLWHVTCYFFPSRSLSVFAVNGQLRYVCVKSPMKVEGLRPERIV